MNLGRATCLCCLLSITSPVLSSPSFTAEQLRLPGKKGIGYSLPAADSPRGTPQQNDAFRRAQARRTAALRVSWNYSWGMQLVAEQPARVEFIPMAYGGLRMQSPDVPRLLVEAMAREVEPHLRAGRIRRLLGPNEPDRKEHGNLTVAQTLALWPAMEALGIPLCSPSCANTEGSDATDTMTALGLYYRSVTPESPDGDQTIRMDPAN